MATFTIHHPWAFTFGVLGNIISFMVYLAPLLTFYRVYKKKSTEGFQSIPYVVSLFSAMLWLYYAFLKTDDPLLITINSFGCVIQTMYVAIFLRYAPRKARILTAKLLLLLNLGTFCSILLLTLLLSKGSNRIHVLGWVCVAFSIIVFAAPLSIVKLVISTKSVEFMPFSLSFLLTISAVMWFFYGLLQKDIYIAVPNVIGFVLGVFQMVLYAVYKKNCNEIQEVEKLPERIVDVIRLAAMVHPIDIQPNHHDHENNNIGEDRKVDEKTHKNEKTMEIPT